MLTQGMLGERVPGLNAVGGLIDVKVLMALARQAGSW